MIVIDAAAVVDALSGTVGTDRLRQLFSAEELHAPNLIDYEVLSAVRGLTLGRALSVGRALDLLADFDDLRIDRWGFPDPLRRRAFELRDNVSAYDAAYLALAEALDCPLVTRDARLSRSTGHDVSILVC